VVYEPHLTLRVVPPQKVVRFGRVCRIVFGGASTVSLTIALLPLSASFYLFVALLWLLRPMPVW